LSNKPIHCDQLIDVSRTLWQKISHLMSCRHMLKKKRNISTVVWTETYSQFELFVNIYYLFSYLVHEYVTCTIIVVVHQTLTVVNTSETKEYIRLVYTLSCGKLYLYIFNSGSYYMVSVFTYYNTIDLSTWTIVQSNHTFTLHILWLKQCNEWVNRD
jgi:hypothetical protein